MAVASPPLASETGPHLPTSSCCALVGYTTLGYVIKLPGRWVTSLLPAFGASGAAVTHQVGYFGAGWVTSWGSSLSGFRGIKKYTHLCEARGGNCRVSAPWRGIFVDPPGSLAYGPGPHIIVYIC